MNLFKRMLALMLCLVLLCGAFPALSEEIQDPTQELILEIVQEELIPEEVQPTEAPTPAPTLVPEQESAPTLQLLPLLTEQEEPQPPAEPSDDPSDDPSAQPSPDSTEEPTPAPEDPLPPAMLVSQTEITLGLWEKVGLQVSFSDGEDHIVTYTSDNPNIARVDADGTVSANYYGTTTIRLQGEFGNEASVNVTVLLAPTAVWATAPKYLLGAGEQVQLTTALSYNSASALKFVSTDEAILTVDQGGLVHAVAPGSAYIGVQTYNNRIAWLRFIVYPAPETMALKQDSTIMGVGEERTLSPEMTPGSLTVCSYTSSNPDAVQVDSSGRVKALAVGEAAITVETHNGLRDTLHITVKQAPTSVSFGCDRIDLAYGQAVDLPVFFGSEEEGGGHSFITGNWRIAYIDGENRLQSHGVGHVYIGVTTYNGKTAYIPATVWNAPAWIVLNASEKTLGEDEAFTLQATIPAYSRSDITFSSDNEAVATVDAQGNVTAHARGTAVITAETYNGKRASCTVHVKGAPEYVEFDREALILGVGETVRPEARLSPDSISELTFSCGSDILQLNAKTGEIKALAVGETTVTVSTHNGKRDTLAVTVKQAPSTVAFAQTTIDLAYGQTVDLPEVILGAEGEDCAGSYSFINGNWRIAYVDENGRLRGQGVGQAYIGARTYNGKLGLLLARVWNAPAWIVLNASEKTLSENEAFTLQATIPAYSRSDIAFSSDNEAIATVDAQGNVTAHARGTAVITAETYNGKRASCTVYVKGAPEYVEFAGEGLILGVGETARPEAVLSPDSISELTFSCGSDILQLNAATGEIKALAVGETTVTVETHNGKSDILAVTVKQAPSTVAFAQTTIDLAYGQTVDLPEVILGAEGEDCAGSYSFINGNWRIAYVDENGKLRGQGVGQAYIGARTYNGKLGLLLARVWNAPAWISLNANEKTLGENEAFTLQATIPAYSHSPITYSSDNEAVATVDAQGNVIALAPGRAVITAETFNGKAASCTVTVKQAPTDVSFARENLLLGWYETRSAELVFPAGQGGGCSFRVEDESIAAVDETGKITGKALGETTLHVRTYNGEEASCTVTVKNAPLGVVMQENSLILSAGDTYQIATPTLLGEDAVCSTYNYITNNAWVASVDQNGLITANAPGGCYVAVAAYNNRYDNMPVWVLAAPESIAFAEEPRPLLVDDVYTPVVTFSNNAVGNYTLSSSDAAIARIGDDGRSIVAIAGGEATITATSYNGKTAEITLRVKHLPDRVELNPDAVTLGAGDSAELTPVMPDGQGSHVYYTSSDPAVATADESGKLTAHSEGSAVITVHTKNEKTADCAVTVMRAPSRVTLTPRSAQRSLEEGGIQLSLSFGADAEGGRVAYTSSDETIAAVDESGYVSFLKEGTVRITAESYNLRQGYCDLEIGKAPEAMAFAEDEICIALGDSITVPVAFEGGCESYCLISQDESIASTHGDTVMGLQPGSVTLTAESISGLKAQCTLTVVSAPTEMTLEQESLDLILNVSKPTAIVPRFAPENVGSARFTSSNPDVAAVDYITGDVYPIGVGECTITALSYDGSLSAQCAVTVRHLLAGVKVGIDPGHQRYPNLGKEAKSPFGGGSKYKVSAGATGKYTRVKEHWVNLEVGLKLRDALESFGAEVYMTRETADVDISNKERALMMNALGVDVVLRLHCNSADVSSARGITIKVRKTGFEQYNCALAGYWVYNHMLWKTGAYKRGLDYTDEFTGLNWSTVPSMLIEMGFMSNPVEDWLLINPDYQQLLIEGMINGICAYKGLELAYPYE